MHVSVHNGNVEQAIRHMRKKQQREGVLRRLKEIRFYEKPSQKRVRKKAESVRRRKKQERKRKEIFGY